MPPQAQEQQPRQPQPSRAAPDPHSDPVGYLKANGYEPIGNPDWPNCLWIDKTRPMFAQEEKVAKEAPFLKPDPENPKKGKWVTQQVKQRIANASGHSEEYPVFQVVHTPAQTPVFMQEALLRVMEREHQKQVEATRKKAVA